MIASSLTRADPESPEHDEIRPQTESKYIQIVLFYYQFQTFLFVSLW